MMLSTIFGIVLSLTIMVIGFPVMYWVSYTSWNLYYNNEEE